MSKDRIAPANKDDWSDTPESLPESVSEFTESYASFNRILNSLQRKYLDLKEEFSQQNDELARTNVKLLQMTRENLSANEFLNGLLSSITVGVIAVDKNGLITHFNPAAAILFGVATRDVLGQSYRSVIPAGEPPKASALRTIETFREANSVEKEVTLADGTRLCLSVSTSIVKDGQGEPAGAVEVLHDLSKIKKMEMEITRLNTLAALGEMAATIAHEVRNPLAGISGFAGLLKRDIPTDDPRHSLVQKISTGVENLNKTITSLLVYTKVDEVRREEGLFDDFLRRTIKQYRHDHANQLKDMELILHPAHGVGASAIRLDFDPVLMRQCFFNLFSNAIQACDSKGSITIEYTKLPRQKAARKYGNQLILGLDETVVETKISDSGPGLPPGSLSELFTPFYSTSTGGTGLGLAMVWKIIKAHGGDVIAENGPKGGAQFTILLPTKINRDHPKQKSTER